MASRSLPDAFADLEPLVDEWALSSERDRYHKLHGSTIDALRAFYDAMLPRMDAALEYLDRFTASEMPDDARTLFDLALTFAETAHPIDLKWRDVDFESAYAWDRMQFLTVSETG